MAGVLALHDITSQDLITAGSMLGAGLLVGAILRVALGPLHARAARSSSRTNELIIGSLGDLLPAAAIVGGAWLAQAQLPLTSSLRRVIGHWLLAATVLVVTLVAARLAAQGTRLFTMSRTGVAPATSIFAAIVRIGVLVIGLLVLLGSLGVSITPLLTALGVGGLAVALALQDTLTNLFAGIHILASKKIEPGDYVKLSSGEEGYVVDVDWRNTSIRALPDNMILVPNGRLSSEIVINYHRPFCQMSVLVQVGVSYDSDLEEVERVTIDVARKVMKDVEGGVPDHEPFIRYHTFASSSIDFSVILRAKQFTDQYLITHEFLKRLHRRYRSEGVQIPYPIRTVVMSPAA